MGFITSANTLTLTAKLTPVGRQRLISTNNALITTFSLGDSDANYNVPLTLTTGQVPSMGGTIGANSSVSNSTIQNTSIKSPLIVNSSGLLRKSVESQSIFISYDIISNGTTTLSGSSLSFNVINRDNYNTDSLVNLYYSFGLPLNSEDDLVYTGTTFSRGGYSDTALSGLAQTKILVVGVNNASYGESLDGKAIRFVLPTSAGTYNLYSTFENKNTSRSVEDANFRDTSIVTSKIGSNIAVLVSDDIMTPNGGSPSLSWSTGFGTVKPFSNNGKQFYNLQTNSNLGLTADTVVGIAYLDKGFLVITNPTIVNNFTSSATTASTITFESVSSAVYQNVTCLANRGEFGASTNTTFDGSDIPRITEIGLYDDLGNLIALAKTDRQVTKNINEFKAFNIKINL
jgi:hypothetical protein